MQHFMQLINYRRKFNKTKWKKKFNLLNVLEKRLNLEYIITTKKGTVMTKDRLLLE